MRLRGACAIEEESDSGILGERGEHVLVFAGKAQPGPARDEKLQLGARGDEVDEEGGRLGEMFEVVEHEQEPAVTKVLR